MTTNFLNQFTDKFGELISIGDPVIYVNEHRRAKGLVHSILTNSRGYLSVIIQTTNDAGRRELNGYTKPVSPQYVYKLTL